MKDSAEQRPRLKPGDHIRVIAPSRSMAIIDPSVQTLARERLEAMGLTVSYGDHVAEVEALNSGSIAGRIDDLHSAFADSAVDGILTAIGGFNSIQLLPYIDCELIKAHPKPFCGFSDISLLNNAFYARAGLISYSGPHFSSFGMEQGLDFTLEYFQRCVMSNTPVVVESADRWSDDLWFLDQHKRTFINNPGMEAVNPGCAQGIALCGNLNTFNLLQGSAWMPSLTDSVLFIEMDGAVLLEEFDRLLESLMLQPGFDAVRGMVLGRFQTGRHFDDQDLRRLLRSKRQLSAMPVVINADFGHTTPVFTFPVGGLVSLSAEPEQTPQLKFL